MISLSLPHFHHKKPNQNLFSEIIGDPPHVDVIYEQLLGGWGVKKIWTRINRKQSLSVHASTLALFRNVASEIFSFVVMGSDL